MFAAALRCLWVDIGKEPFQEFLKPYLSKPIVIIHHFKAFDLFNNRTIKQS